MSSYKGTSIFQTIKATIKYITGYKTNRDYWDKKATEFEAYLHDLDNSYVYINVTGPFNAGKTQFIETISEIPVRAIEAHILYAPVLGENYKWPYVSGLDLGQIKIEEQLFLFLFGTPGTRSIALFALDQDDLKGKCLGTVFVVDSTRPETFREVRKLLNQFRANEPFRPYVIAINKQDDPNAWDMDDLELVFSKTSDEVFIPCSAVDKESVKNVILVLLYRARDSFEN